MAKAKKPQKKRPAPRPESRPAEGRLPNGQFAPGASGNPGGQHGALKEFRASAQELAPMGMDRLARHLNHKNPFVVQGAVKLIFERAWGKPPQPITGEGGEGAVQVELVATKLLEELRRLVPQPQAPTIVVDVTAQPAALPAPEEPKS